MPRYYSSSKPVIHQAEPSLRSGYTGSDYTRSSGYYTTSASSGSSTPRSSHSYYPESFTVREHGAKDHTMSVHSRGNVVVVNRHQSIDEPGAPSSYQSNWAARDKSSKSKSKK